MVWLRFSNKITFVNAMSLSNDQGAKKLERALMSIRELQNSLRDGVILFRALLEELRRNMDEERQGIVMSYESLHEAIKQTYDSLLTSLDSQYNTTDR